MGHPVFMQLGAVYTYINVNKKSAHQTIVLDGVYGRILIVLVYYVIVSSEARGR